jgi:hypothetical protein
LIDIRGKDLQIKLGLIAVLITQKKAHTGGKRVNGALLVCGKARREEFSV